MGVMTLEELREFNSKQKYPWIINVTNGVLDCYNPLYSKPKGGYCTKMATDTYEEFIEENMKRNVFGFVRDSIEYDNMYLKVEDDVVYIPYNISTEEKFDIGYMKFKRT